MDLNQSSVLGTLVEGIGYTQVNGVLAGMGIPYVTDKTFKSHQETVLSFTTIEHEEYEGS